MRRRSLSGQMAGFDRFQKRYNIKEYKQHGEGVSAEVNTPLAIQQMNNLRLSAQTTTLVISSTWMKQAYFGSYNQIALLQLNRLAEKEE